ncbi:MAG: cupin domain-containing protein [Candidatus Marinimicrobia bacterium]|nr:cupin domain-containing protein [Candidatus Neomarinimicrobiota bacterium]
MSELKITGQGLEPAHCLDLINDIQINPGAIVSKTLRKSAQLNLTLFAFDKGQALSGHSSPMDAYVQVLSGKMDITVGEETSTVNSNQIILMPAGINHALEAMEPSRMLLTMVSV